MKLFDNDFDLVQGALSDGLSVSGKTADGVSTVIARSFISSKNKNFLGGWEVVILVDYEGDNVNGSNGEKYLLHKVKNTSVDSMFIVTSIFLSLAKHGTIDVELE